MGDEIINVCGKRLRGLSIEEAIKALKQPKRELDIVVARDQSDNNNEIDTIASFLDEERLKEEHRRIAQKIHAFDFHETCSEVNLSSRPSKNGKSNWFCSKKAWVIDNF